MRELVVTSFRIVAMGNGLELAADGWGKAKTFVQNVAVDLTLLAWCGSRPSCRAPCAVGLGGPDLYSGTGISQTTGSASDTIGDNLWKERNIP